MREYDGNGGNGTRAYLAVYPRGKSVTAAAVSAHQLLRIPKIRARLDELRAARFRRLQMDGDEALALVAGDARGDMRELFDEKGNLLPPHLWPDVVARSVKGYKLGVSVTMNDSLHARRIVLEQTGKLKNPLAAAGVSLAKILAGDFSDVED